MLVRESEKQFTDALIHIIHTYTHLYILHREESKHNVQMTKFFFLTSHVCSSPQFYIAVTEE